MMVVISIFLLGLSVAQAQLTNPFSVATRPPLQDDPEKEEDDNLCSYTPDVFNFELMFKKNCIDETLSENEGIDDTLCYFNYGVTPEYVDPRDVTFGGSGGSRRGLLRTGQEVEESTIDKMQRVLAAENVPVSSHYKHAVVHSHYKHATSVQGQRAVQVNDPYPTVITSVTFVEFDANINDVINQNSTYFDTTLNDGDVITYPSISAGIDKTKPLSEQTDLLTGGIMLILFGVNEDNVVVRNTIAWAYKLTDCTKKESLGDTIGWVKIDNYTPPKVLPLLVEGEEEEETTTAFPTMVPVPLETREPMEEEETVVETTPPPPVVMSMPQETLPWAKSSKGTKSIKSNKSATFFSKSAKGAKSTFSYDTTILIPTKSDKGTASADLFAKSGKGTKSTAFSYDNTKSVKAFGTTNSKAIKSSKSSTFDPKAEKVQSTKAQKMFTKSAKGLAASGTTHVERPAAIEESVMSVPTTAVAEESEVREYPWEYDARN